MVGLVVAYSITFLACWAVAAMIPILFITLKYDDTSKFKTTFKLMPFIGPFFAPFVVLYSVYAGLRHLVYLVRHAHVLPLLMKQAYREWVPAPELPEHEPKDRGTPYRG